MWNVSSILEGLEHEQRVNADLRGKSVFNLCVIFLWIFVCIHVLSKLTQLVELFLCQRLLGQKQWYDVRTIKSEWEQTLQLYEDDKSQLDAQVRELREKNLSLERLMADLRDYNIHLISENFMLSVMHEQKPRPAEPNIYITNSHFHLTRQMFLNESQINLNVHDAGEKGASGEGKNVWLQYLRMRKCYMSPIADPNLVDPSTTKQILPIVMSTEQLAEMHDLVGFKLYANINLDVVLITKKKTSSKNIFKLIALHCHLFKLIAPHCH
ncbi:uncharacterized protein LOC6733196 isoform X2 [Drosophila simulans]|uniref:Uncharacterized protein, isoform B n=1 Tax=Drosophila simulans TaxID=7240 RepID=A0A0J9R694_DROSI|nr:uncharacterized protein LOC6733196 isoform X2 [Drosophila simulans]KMY91707.1 uncharacterized protein Dsimw501_GD10397, isoform B [Drosophila simulans]